MIFRIVIILLVGISFFSCKKTPELYLNYSKGDAFGTTFSVQFINKTELNLSTSYDSIIEVINTSMSTYQRDSDISKINLGDTTISIDAHFRKVFNASKRIYKETEGIFDPTIGVLQHSNTFIDFNSLAKGYAVDVFSEFLAAKGFENYLVEIGGEIRGKGINILKEKPWKIGVEDPNFDQTQSYSKVISLTNEAMATSGSYRKFKLDENGNRYAHIINAKTGYPHQSNLLSVSVLTATCMEADAYATALMSMGLERSKQFLKLHPELKVYFIYENRQKELETHSINGFPNE